MPKRKPMTATEIKRRMAEYDDRHRMTRIEAISALVAPVLRKIMKVLKQH